MTPEADHTSSSGPVNVTIRGAGGVLGRRLLRTLLANDLGIRIDTLIVNGDRESAERLAQLFSVVDLPPAARILVDDTRSTIRQLGRSGLKQLEPFCFESLSSTASGLLIDATAEKKGSSAWEGYFEERGLTGVVLHQSGASEKHPITAAPFPTPQHSGRLRQGDCLISGLAPILHAFRDQLRTVSLSALIQLQSRATGFWNADRAVRQEIRPALANRTRKNLLQLLSSRAVREVHVFETFGADYYLCHLALSLISQISRREILDRLAAIPRVAVLPRTFLPNTQMLTEGYRENVFGGGRVPKPIICFSAPGGVKARGTEVGMTVAIDSLQIASLANVDSLLVLGKGMQPLEAMKEVDRVVLG